MKQMIDPKPGFWGRWLVLAAIVAVTFIGARHAPPPSPTASIRIEPLKITGEIQHFTLLRNPRDRTALRLVDGKGRQVELAAFRGKVVVLNFWATWCAPCIKEMPSLARLARHFKGAEAARFALIAVNEDRGGPDRALPFLKRIGLPDLPVYFDGTGEAQRLIGAGSLPTTVVIDGRGRERGRLVGPADWSSPEAVALIRHFISAER